MKVLTPGHLYVLENFEFKDSPGQRIQFIEKVPLAGDTTKLVTVNDGTTTEEILKVLINRMEHLYSKFPSEETACSLQHLRIALYAQQSRTFDRMQRGVEGQHKA